MYVCTTLMSNPILRKENDSIIIVSTIKKNTWEYKLQKNCKTLHWKPWNILCEVMEEKGENREW